MFAAGKRAPRKGEQFHKLGEVTSVETTPELLQADREPL